MSLSVDVIRAKISSAYLLMVSFLLISALGGLIYRSIDVGWQAIQLPTLATMGIWWLIAVFRTKFSHQVRSYTTIACLFVISTFGIFNLGLLSMGIPGYMAVCILAAIFLGVDKAIYAICICMLSIIAIGYGVSSGDLLISVDAAVFNTSKGAWTATSIVFFVTIGSLILCLAGLMGALMTLVGRVQEQGAELMVCHDHLEELVADRTLELTKEIEVREEREIALKISEERFKGFADVAADRYWESDANHNIIYAPSVSKIVRELNVTILGKLA